MAQPPAGYGWFGPPVNQNPYAPQIPYGTPYMQPPGAAPFNNPMAFGWQLPGQPAPSIGTFNGPYSTVPTAPTIGFGFDMFNSSGLPQPAPNSYQPPAPVSSNDPIPTEVTSPVESGSTVVILSSNSDQGARSSPLARKPLATSESPVTSDSAPQSKQSGDDHRGSSRYQEGLKNMADLMTDVDLTDEVLDTVKSRFGLK